MSSRCSRAFLCHLVTLIFFRWRLQYGMLDGKVEDQGRLLARCLKKGQARGGASFLIGYFSDLDAGCN